MVGVGVAVAVVVVVGVAVAVGVGVAVAVVVVVGVAVAVVVGVGVVMTAPRPAPRKARPCPLGCGPKLTWTYAPANGADHYPPCTPALRALVRAAERWRRVDPGQADTPLERAVDRFRREREAR